MCVVRDFQVWKVLSVSLLKLSRLSSEAECLILTEFLSKGEVPRSQKAKSQPTGYRYFVYLMCFPSRPKESTARREFYIVADSYHGLVVFQFIKVLALFDR